MNLTNTNIIGNKLNEKLVQQKKEVNVVELSDGTVALVTTSTGGAAGQIVVMMRREKKIFLLQKVNDPYIFSNHNYTKILLENPSPANLDKDVTLDAEESINFSNTSTNVVLTQKFILTEIIERDVTDTERAVISVSARVTSTAGTVFLDKCNVAIGYFDTSDTFFPQMNADMTPSFSTTSTSYIEITGQSLINTNVFTLDPNKRFGIEVKVYAHVDLVATTAKVRINCTRGSADSYIEFITQ